MTSEPAAESSERVIDMTALKVLAHPLRVQIIDALSQHGPATASGLAERLGESSGATSYHLRQLARHEFVRELAGRGTGRERWWERTPGRLTLSPNDHTSEAGRAAATLVMRQWRIDRDNALNHYLDRGMDVLPEPWLEASVLASADVRLTREQLEQFTAEWLRFSEQFLGKYRGTNQPGSRPVQVQFNAFPLIDGEETPT